MSTPRELLCEARDGPVRTRDGSSPDCAASVAFQPARRRGPSDSESAVSDERGLDFSWASRFSCSSMRAMMSSNAGVRLNRHHSSPCTRTTIRHGSFRRLPANAGEKGKSVQMASLHWAYSVGRWADVLTSSGFLSVEGELVPLLGDPPDPVPPGNVAVDDADRHVGRVVLELLEQYMAR